MSDEPLPKEDQLASALQGVGPDEYGPAYREHSLDIYKICLEMADRISERREKANSLFLAVNAPLIALLAKDAFGSPAVPPGALELLVPVSAGVLCYLWYRNIRSYRDLNLAKFKVIHAIERRLPLRPSVRANSRRAVGRVAYSLCQPEGTHIRVALPLGFREGPLPRTATSGIYPSHLQDCKSKEILVKQVACQ